MQHLIFGSGESQRFQKKNNTPANSPFARKTLGLKNCCLCKMLLAPQRIMNLYSYFYFSPVTDKAEDLGSLNNPNTVSDVIFFL